VVLLAKDGRFDSRGGVDEPTARFLQSWMDRYVNFVVQNVP